MKNRRLISLMLAGMITLGVGAMTGCEEYEQTEEAKTYDLLTGVDEGFIVLRVNDKDILHKGKVEYLSSGVGKYSVYMGFNSYEFDCGKTYTSNSQSFISTTMPTEEVYDEICEDCFGK